MLSTFVFLLSHLLVIAIRVFCVYKHRDIASSQQDEIENYLSLTLLYLAVTVLKLFPPRV